MILRYEVEYVVEGGRLASAPPSLTYPEGVWVLSVPDELKGILGDEKAKVSVSLGHKIGGPHYSSVSLYVSVSLTCDQSEDSVTKAKEIATESTMSFIDEYLPGCYEHLTRLVGDIVT